jgi:hypothetical protein
MTFGNRQTLRISQALFTPDQRNPVIVLAEHARPAPVSHPRSFGETMKPTKKPPLKLLISYEFAAILITLTLAILKIGTCTFSTEGQKEPTPTKQTTPNPAKL